MSALKAGRAIGPAPVLVLVGLLLPAAASGQQACQQRNDPLAYQPRPLNEPTYCEGYVEAEDVSGEETYLVTLYYAGAPLEVASGDPVTVSWATWLTDGKVQLRALGIPGRLDRYRMDAAITLPRTEFTWDMEFLQTQDIQPEDLGVLAWSQATLEGAPQRVYVPLRFYRGESPPTDGIVAGIWTSATLDSARLSLSAGGTGEEVEAELRTGELIAGVIEFVLPDVGGGDFYLAQFSGATRSNVPVSDVFWLYVPPR